MRFHRNLLFVLAFLVGCSVPSVDPLQLKIGPLDQETTRFPPQSHELIHQPRMMVELLTHEGMTVTGNRQSELLEFVHHSLSTFGGFSYVPQMDVKAQLETTEFLGFHPTSVVQALRLGQQLNANFVAQVELEITESKLVDGIDRYKANIGLTVFTVNTGQLIFKETLVYNSAKAAKSSQKTKRAIQSAFPLKGFIVETRGEREVAKITLGSSSGMKVGRKVQVRSRVVEHSLIRGVNQERIQYSAEVLATGEVIQVSENEAWIWLPKNDRKKIKNGDLVFTLPEATRSLL